MTSIVVTYCLEYAEYRVPGPDATEAQAYYTQDKDDAIDTAKAIFGANVKIEFQDVEGG